MYCPRIVFITLVLLTICQFTNTAGDTSEHLPASCAEAVHFSGRTPSSGIYRLSAQFPDRGYTTFYAYCLLDPAGGEAWTLIQRRQDGSIHFNRDWRDYKNGFGNLNTNFFIGLEKLHAITDMQLHELWILLGDFNNVEKDARYESFAIGGEELKYALTVLGGFSGTANDSLTTFHDGCKFSTHDHDNSERGTNCAEVYKGGWWFAKEFCVRSFLHGVYKDKPSTSYGEGLVWMSWHGPTYSLKYVHMAIRPKYNSFV